MNSTTASERSGIVLASVLVAVTVLATLICALAQARQAWCRHRRHAALRLLALHLAEGLAEEGRTAPRGELRLGERPLSSLGSLRTDLERLGADPASLPRGLTVERSLRRWKGLEAVLVVVSWHEEGRGRSLRISLPRVPPPSPPVVP